VFGTLGVAEQGDTDEVPKTIPNEYEQPLHELMLTYQEVNARNVQEAFHDAQQALDMATNLFGGGYLPLDQRVVAENLFFAICHKIRKLLKNADDIPDDLSGLDRMLADTFFCNFSLFQSMPDSWAVSQLFPVMPIHRLNEAPTQHAVLSDITCDSDGKIDQFIDRRDVKRTLQLHHFNNEPYYLGAFLIGAYQEILGDLHNLFGDTNAVHVRLNDKGGYDITDLVEGDTVTEVLNYVQFGASQLLATFRRKVNSSSQLSREEANTFIAEFVAGLEGYTYLEGEAAR
jgi:arginine decarboxylase